MWRGILGLTVLLFSLTLSAQDQDPLARDHELLRKLLQDTVAAVNKLDTEALKAHLAPDFAITFIDKTRVTNIEELEAYLQRTFRAADAPLKGMKIAPEAEVESIFLSPDIAIDYGRSSDTYTLRNGDSVVIDSYWTATLVRHAWRWKIKSFHASANILDNPVLDATRQSTWAFGLLGVLLGAAGVGGFLFLRRKRMGVA